MALSTSLLAALAARSEDSALVMVTGTVWTVRLASAYRAHLLERSGPGQLALRSMPAWGVFSSWDAAAQHGRSVRGAYSMAQWSGNQREPQPGYRLGLHHVDLARDVALAVYVTPLWPQPAAEIYGVETLPVPYPVDSQSIGDSLYTDASWKWGMADRRSRFKGEFASWGDV